MLQLRCKDVMISYIMAQACCCCHYSHKRGCCCCCSPAGACHQWLLRPAAVPCGGHLWQHQPHMQLQHLQHTHSGAVTLIHKAHSNPTRSTHGSPSSRSCPGKHQLELYLCCLPHTQLCSPSAAMRWAQPYAAGKSSCAHTWERTPCASWLPAARHCLAATELRLTCFLQPPQVVSARRQAAPASLPCSLCTCLFLHACRTMLLCIGWQCDVAAAHRFCSAWQVVISTISVLKPHAQRWFLLKLFEHSIIIIIIMLPNQAIASTPSAPRPFEHSMSSLRVRQSLAASVLLSHPCNK
jgi:hypothetical protein